jgi:ABC-2 type transport system permease protein
MLRALLYLRIMSFRNWVLWRVRRLRQPKYLAGFVVGTAYLYFFFFRRLGRPRPFPTQHGADAVAQLTGVVPTEWHAIAVAIGAVALLVGFTFLWVVPARPAALGFSEAEIAFLFPAPCTRRSLIHFRLISSQLRSFVGALVMAIISNRWGFLGGNALTHAVGWWFVFSTLNLHFNGANFTLTRFANAGLNVYARRVLVLMFVATIVAITLWRMPDLARFPATDKTAQFRLVSDWLVDVTSVAPLNWLLFPLRIILAPFLASDLSRFCWSLPPAIALVALHYLWVVQAAVAFEDASVEQAEKRTARIAAWRSGERRFGRAPTQGRAAPFRLAPTGRPEIAFLWKNLLSTWPYFTVRVFAWTVLALAVMQTWRSGHPAAEPFALTLGMLGAGAGAYLLVIGPQFARQDIRGDFHRIDLLKTFPLAGWQVVLGEILAPTVILTGLIWLGLLEAAFSASGFGPLSVLAGSTLVVGSLSVAALVPAVVMLQLLVPNAAALLFPSWAEATRSRTGGPEVMGQRMIYFVAQLLTMVVVLLPASGMAVVVIMLMHYVFGLNGAVSVACAAVPMLAVLIGEIAVGMWWLGQRFEAIDVSAELSA